MKQFLSISLLFFLAHNSIAQNVGIGTTAPAVKLHVVKDIAPFPPYFGSTMAVQSNSDTYLQILSGDYANYGGGIMFGNALQNISAGISFNTFAGKELSFYTNGSLPSAVINNLGNLGIHTINPKAPFNVAAGKTVLFGFDTSDGGSKMIWYPSKYAFRAGFIDPATNGNTANWDYVNVGAGSFATGFNNFASGLYSSAIGSYNRATGEAASAIGGGNTVSGIYSTAIGIENSSTGNYAVAIGSGIGAKSAFETVLGRLNTDYTPASVTDWNGTDRLFTIGNGNSTRSDAMVVLKNGNTGIGTSTPDAKLTVSQTSSSPQIKIFQGAGNDYARLRLTNLNSNTNNRFWDVAGIIDAASANNDRLNFYNIGYGNVLSLTGNGNAGFGTTNPGYRLDVAGDINASGQVRANGIALSSDARYKKNIITLPNALTNLLQLRGANYFFNTQAFPDKNFSPDKQTGLVAQEVEKIFPELVTTDKDGYKSVNYIGLIPVLIESIKTLQKEIDELKKKVK